MAHRHGNRIRETTTTTGTGNYTTSGTAVAGGFKTIASKLTANGDTGWFCVQMGNEYEVVNLKRVSATEYSRFEIKDSTNSGNAVSWGAGTKDIFSVKPAETQNAEVISADMTLFVKTAASGGSDASNGKTLATAFASLQQAATVIAGYQILAGVTLTVSVAAGTYTGGGSVELVVFNGWSGGGTVRFLGDSGTPGNVILDGNTKDVFRISTGVPLGVTLTIRGFRMTGGATGGAIRNSGQGEIIVQDCEFGANLFCLFTDQWSARISLAGTLAIVGNVTIGKFFDADAGEISGSATINIGGTVTLGTGFAVARFRGYLLSQHTYNVTGSVTGPRYVVSDDGEINTQNAGESHFPGSTAGIMSTGGSYDGRYATAGHIRFPATQSASSGANDLDDYEEGTWTPGITFATPGDLSVAYTTQSGGYTKVGRMVHVQGNLLTSSFTHTTASGNARVTGLPFTVASSSNSPTGSTSWQNITKANYTQVNGFFTSGQTYATLFASGSGQAVSGVSASNMPSGGNPVDIALSGSYYV